MAKKYVMANRTDGVSDIVSAEEMKFPEVGGMPALDVWINKITPADLSSGGDYSPGAVLLHEPPDGGAIFRLVKFMPGIGDSMTADQVAAMHKSLNSLNVPSADYLRNAKHPTMHKTDTLNYFVVVSGQMWSLSEGQDVLLKPGDVMVQKGCMHGWRVDGPEPCILAAVLIDAHPA